VWRGHSPESFVAKYSGENAGEILHAPEGEVTVAERRADDPYPDLVRLGRVDDDLLDGQRLPSGPAHGRFASDGSGALLLVLHGEETRSAPPYWKGEPRAVVGCLELKRESRAGEEAETAGQSFVLHMQCQQ